MLGCGKLLKKKDTISSWGKLESSKIPKYTKTKPHTKNNDSTEGNTNGSCMKLNEKMGSKGQSPNNQKQSLVEMGEEKYGKRRSTVWMIGQ